MKSESATKTVSVHVSGDCPQCGITNNATLTKEIPAGHRGVSLVVANGDLRQP